MIDFQDNRGAPLLALRHLLGSCSRLFLPLLVLLVTLRPDAAARAQLPAQVIADPPAVIEPLTVSALQDRRRLVDENTTLDAAARTALQETLAGAIRALQEEEAYLEQTRALQALTENAAAELEATRSKLEAPAAQPQMPSESDELSASQQKLTELEEQLRTAESLKSQLDQRDVLQSKRRTESPAELTRAKVTLEALEKEPAADDAGLSPDVAFANAALRQARRRAVVAKIAFLERELPAYEATAALLAAQRSLAARRVTVARRAVGTWQEHVNRQRMSQAEANADEAGRLVQNASPQASALADEVLNLALKLVDVRSGLAIEIASTNRSISLVETETARLKTEADCRRADNASGRFRRDRRPPGRRRAAAATAVGAGDGDRADGAARTQSNPGEDPAAGTDSQSQNDYGAASDAGRCRPDRAGLRRVAGTAVVHRLASVCRWHLIPRCRRGLCVSGHRAAGVHGRFSQTRLSPARSGNRSLQLAATLGRRHSPHGEGDCICGCSAGRAVSTDGPDAGGNLSVVAGADPADRGPDHAGHDDAQRPATGQLINWTLSDAVLRLTLQVGIAYGSDTRLATELLYRVAAEEPDVLEEPLPRAVFYCFGESSLDFELRCFVTSPQVYRVIRHDLNMAIDDLFRQHNIEIAFPQRDLHLRSMEVPVAIENVRQSSNGEKPVKRTT